MKDVGYIATEQTFYNADISRDFKSKSAFN